MQWTVRRANEYDVAELARVNIESWREAYRGIVADEFLDTMDSARRELGWRRWVALPDPDAVFVAVNGSADRIASYASICAVREASDAHPTLPTGELAAIYADPTVWGRGAGHAVHEAAVSALSDLGFRHAVLWVFVDNTVARQFYRRHGWRSDGVFEEFEVAGRRPLEMRYSRAL